MDIIFERFTIRKVAGRVDYRWTGDASRDFWRESMAIDAKSTLATLHSTPEHLLDDCDRASLLIARLFTCADAGDLGGLRTLARQIIAGQDERVSFEEEYAVYLLGFHGDRSDLPALTQLLLCPETDPLAARNTRDAIERILERQQENHP